MQKFQKLQAKFLTKITKKCKDYAKARQKLNKKKARLCEIM